MEHSLQSGKEATFVLGVSLPRGGTLETRQGGWTAWAGIKKEIAILEILWSVDTVQNVPTLIET